VDILNGAAQNQIDAGNVISSNAGDGVRIFGAGSSDNRVQGNWIGTDKSGQVALGNTGHGVWLALGAHDNSIGGTATTDGNVIAYNGKAGVAVGDFSMDATTVHNAILSNSIYGNLGLGIDLGDDGVTPNTPGGPHVGPNDFQNAPVIESATLVSVLTSIQVSLDSNPNTVFTIQIFANPAPDASGYGQGKTLVATLTIQTDTTGKGVGVIAVPQNLAGQYLSATATSPANDTSEFSRDFPVR
jgi:titin